MTETDGWQKEAARMCSQECLEKEISFEIMTL
jgi:hypothetical protein